MDRRGKVKLGFAGKLDYFSGGLLNTGPFIAGRDVIAEIERTWPFYSASRGLPAVKVWLGVEPAHEGPLWAIHGFGGTDVTPPESPEIKVGDYNLLSDLYELDGREVLLIIEDA